MAGGKKFFESEEFRLRQLETDGCAIDALMELTHEIPERNIALMRGTQLTTPLGRHPDFRSVAELYQRAAKDTSSPVGQKLANMKLGAVRVTPAELKNLAESGKQIIVDIPENRHIALLEPDPTRPLVFKQVNGPEPEVELIDVRRYRAFVFEKK